MTYQELEARCKDRVFDQIMIVTDDIFTETANLRKIYHFEPDDIRSVTETVNIDGEDQICSQYEAFGWIGDIELKIVEQTKGTFILKQYLGRFGPGICCLREQIAEEEFEAVCAKYEAKGLRIGQSGPTYRIYDLMDEIGILYAIHAVKEVKAVSKNDRKICQINITCPDVEGLVRKMEDLLEIGPYEIGHINNQTVKDLGILVEGEMAQPEFEYLLGMNTCGNLEIETISPVKGPNCFADFIKKRPAGGFNHLKEVVPLSTGKWEEERTHYESLGLKQCIKGKIGPCGWCFVDTMKDLGFLVELGDGEPMTQLPEGYNAYFIPPINGE